MTSAVDPIPDPPSIAQHDPRRNVNRTIRTTVTALVAAAVTLPVAIISGGGQAAATSCVTPAQLHTAALRGDTAVARLTVNWAAGTADYVTAAPLCQTMWGSAAQNVYWVGARPVAGHGAALWPQTRAVFTAPQPLTGAGHHPFRIPVVTNECGQGDVAVADHPTPWPAVQAGPGTPQPPTRYYVPGTPGERVGNGRGCYPPPSVSGAPVCPACVGAPGLALTLTNRAPYATVRVVPTVNGRRLAPISIPAGRSAVLRLAIRDGDRWNLAWQAGYGRWTPLARLTPDSTVACPPPPQVTVTLGCDCGSTIHATVADTNRGRYVHDVTVTAGQFRRTFRTRPGQTVSTAFGITRGQQVTVTVQNLLPGHLVGGPVRAAQVTAT